MINKINDIGFNNKITINKNKKNSKTVNIFDDLLNNIENDEEIISTNLNDINNINPFVMLQEIGSQHENIKQETQKANNILDSLNELKLQIIQGDIDSKKLLQIKELIYSKKGKSIDPQLNYLLNEIETLALVELAKLGIY